LAVQTRRDTPPPEFAGLSATYSPKDNKLRLYSLHHLPRNVYERVRAAGFSFAPKEDLLGAPMWTPVREDFLLALCGEIGDEDTSLVDCAKQPVDRFEDYSASRDADSKAAHSAASVIADGIPFGARHGIQTLISYKSWASELSEERCEIPLNFWPEFSALKGQGQKTQG
jgi:hypothetical protein